MYAAGEEKRETTLQVSGMLWERSLVMRDKETGSLWSHLLGKCMEGERKGEELELLPGVMTTWGDWRVRHPGTTVLAMSRTARKFTLEAWRKPWRFVYGLPPRPREAARAVSLEQLTETPVVMLPGKRPVVVTFDSKSKRAQAFRAVLDGKPLTFTTSGAGRMKDQESGSSWDAVSGECLTGRWKGKRLSIQPGLISYRQAWEAFHPGTRIIEPAGAGH